MMSERERSERRKEGVREEGSERRKGDKLERKGAGMVEVRGY
jgi:hypothetical protein